MLEFLVGILVSVFIVVLLRRSKPTMLVSSKIHNYSTYLPDEETRLRQALQNGTDLNTFATVEVKDNVATITATRRVEMRVYNGELILHEFGRRGGAGVEIRLSWYACAEGLVGLHLIQLEKDEV